MHSLTKNAKESLTSIVNTILYCHANLNEAAQKSQWSRYNKTRKDLYRAIIKLNDEFGVDIKASKENIHENDSRAVS